MARLARALARALAEPVIDDARMAAEMTAPEFD